MGRRVVWDYVHCIQTTPFVLSSLILEVVWDGEELCALDLTHERSKQSPLTVPCPVYDTIIRGYESSFDSA